jgi:hypothetical protein
MASTGEFVETLSLTQCPYSNAVNAIRMPHRSMAARIVSGTIIAVVE